MPRKKTEKPRKRIGVYIETDLLERFQQRYEKWGAFTNVLNDLLRTHLNELDDRTKSYYESSPSL